MDVFKKLLLPIIATIAAVILIAWSLDSFGFRSLMNALLVNWIVMSWVAIAGQVVDFSLPSRYYEIKPFERTGEVRFAVDVYNQEAARALSDLLAATATTRPG